MLSKKSISFFLALTLLVSNIGLAFNVHYCGGEIASVSTVFSSEQACKMVLEPQSKPCCAENSKEDKSCCDNKVVDLQDGADQLVFKTFSVDSAVAFNEFHFVDNLPTEIPVFVEKLRAYHFESHAPPLFKLYRQLILYA